MKKKACRINRKHVTRNKNYVDSQRTPVENSNVQKNY